MFKPKELPRLTNFIRAYGEVAAPWSGNIQYDPEALIKKRIEKREKQAKLFSIKSMKEYLLEYSTCSQNEVDDIIKEFINLAKAIAGSDASTSVIEGSIVFLIELFRDCRIIGMKEKFKLRGQFGEYPPSAASKAFELVKRMVTSLKSEAQEDFISNGFPKSDELMAEEFGSKIKFIDPSPPDDSFYLVPVKDYSSEIKEDAFERLSFKFIPPPPPKEVKTEQTAPKPVNISRKFDQHWLEKELAKSMGSNSEQFSPTEFALTVIQLLKSKSNEEVQSELFDLLGFDNFELIQNILNHRDEILAVKVIDANTKDVYEKNEKRPVCMSQVIVQSETEKLLSKQIRKDEKKIQRDKILGEENAADFNLQRWKQLREEALIHARNQPIFYHPAPEMPITHIYPNVFDINAETRMSASFISGKKLCLPPNHTRDNNSVFEEIHIPAAKPVSDIIEVQRVHISDLDEVAQSAFKNTKALNLIQSKVFETAYKTNHNMLVCAPTGAGKTNVAMLTILREIRNNIVNGVLEKNKFKIVYVAPMKALAAEMVRNFGTRLKSLSIQVKELTGDMQLTKNEIMQTQMLVTTPEKWDVVTRKATGDVALSQLVKLLILDEVHLLDSDRGHVLEALVARTLRQVESSQSMIRILGLSATLPNYIDVASFLRVNPMEGLYFFDDRFRPVPLATTFIGVKSGNTLQQMKDMDEICYDKVARQLINGHQVMVFVHARSSTVRTATILKEIAQKKNELHLFTDAQNTSEYGNARNNILKSRNKQLKELFEHGIAIHHAGMLRSDRNLVEKYFREGLIKVLCCTSTLAWGVNLPARAVIIKGTEVYDSNKGAFVDLNVLDVMQIFGRAGRPQYDNRGEGVIITAHDRLGHYLSLLTRQHQIESKFEERIADNLNAEIALGTVTNVDEGSEWLSYTYLHVRMIRNPHVYGLKPEKIKNDYMLYEHRKSLIHNAALKLNKAQMIRYDIQNGFLNITDMGRTASHFYISTETILRFNEKLRGSYMHDAQIFALISQAQEFDQLKVRDDEMVELDHLLHECYLQVGLGCENTEGKVNILLQAALSRLQIESFSLISDQAYVMQNATRIARALFEVCLRKNWAMLASSFLRISKMLEKQMWSFNPPTYYSPLHQFPELNRDVLTRIDKVRQPIENLQDMNAEEIGYKLRCFKERHIIKDCLKRIPNLEIEPLVQPITDSILRVTLNIKPDFKWSDKHHGTGSEPFWIWIADPETDSIYHFEYFILPKKQVINEETQTLVFTIPLPKDVRPSQYLIRAVSDRWLGADREFAISFQDLILPQHKQPHTDLLNLLPLPKTALKNPLYESLYKFDYFNPIQTQIFHTLYHTDHNVLLGAPTGSGKTIAAEIAILRVFNEYPGSKVIYIAPLKALVRERIEDWRVRFQQQLRKRVEELTGDVTPDAQAIAKADIIVTTPEKWDGVSRSWQTRNYVKAVALIVIDEIHLLGEDRGPVLEVIVSRTNFISAHTQRNLRVIGLSTALANASDIGHWLGIKDVGLYNFRSSVRPVQLEIHVSGHHGKHYCPRMALMNKPTFQAIQTHSPDKPALVFVSSRRQTRLTAIDLIAYLVAGNNHQQWVHMDQAEMSSIVDLIRDQNLKFTIAFGIGIHHAGLHERDRKIVEELFLHQKIQVLIATATLAWGINLPAHLVVIKGTEYFDGKVQRYVDFPITDVMQMAGRAGRPQFDTTGVAVVLVQDIKKNFYKKFLHEPFPVESSLIKVLPEHINAEVVAGTIGSKQQCLDYITWTYLFRRLLQNPGYYGLESLEGEEINKFLSGLINQCLGTLAEAGCLAIDDDERTVSPTVLGKICSYYYLNHRTILWFTQKLYKEATIVDMLNILCGTTEYEELPVRHNEDAINKDLALRCLLEVDSFTYDSPHTKANLLLQAHFSRLQLPCTDYYTDLKSVLDQAIRIIQAMIDVSSDKGWLAPTLLSMTLLQMILQARWHDDNTLLTLPHIETKHLPLLRFSTDKRNDVEKEPIESLPLLISIITNNYELLESALWDVLEESKMQDIYQTLTTLPVISLSAAIKGWWDESSNEEMRSLNLKEFHGRRPDAHWLDVHADQEYVLNVNLQRLSKPKGDRKAIAPKFPKQKEEGWFLVLGSVEEKELIAMKRVPYIFNKAQQQLVFYTPEKTGRVLYKLYFISDSYLGLDQEYDICLNIIEPSIRAQVNTEVLSESESSSEEET
ncbi:activating signal cointegrator 1 complex subunit 3-like [Argiope bruennichi]|uniref:activating signal cointegrator 1 complex subunit 3-like n=1 Tax=Argiope bruennichi TaxID=94029 RepID=UPI002494C8F5|nr:activating signal cointegrator 1 complex subunit 3-like [Argiope bruennichi]XP_055949415.1 activating signal cointegrator 1 complex subunit 3-like [Argiope bruennichi]